MIQNPSTPLAQHVPRVAFLVLALVMLASGLAPSAAAQHRLAEARAHTAEADRAFERGDFAAFRDHLSAALALRPTHPGLVYRLAVAHALNEAHEEALALLNRYADLGLSADVEVEPAFAALQEDSVFVRVAARLAQNAKPVLGSRVAFTFQDPTLVPEGIAYDRDRHYFYVGSVYQRRVVRVDIDGVESPFVHEDDLRPWSVLGVALDRARRAVWATTAALPQTPGVSPQDIGRAGLFRYNLDTGRLVATHLLPPAETPQGLGDLTVHENGDVYVTDGLQGRLYVLRDSTEVLESVLPDGLLASPQGLCFMGEDRLVVADYALGLFAVDVARRTAVPLAQPEGSTLLGIDGVTCRGNELYAVQNGIHPARILRLWIDEEVSAVEEVEVMEANNPVMTGPTLGVLVGAQYLFIANSPWSRLGDDGKLDQAGLTPTYVYRIGL